MQSVSNTYILYPILYPCQGEFPKRKPQINLIRKVPCGGEELISLLISIAIENIRKSSAILGSERQHSRNLACNAEKKRQFVHGLDVQWRCHHCTAANESN
jgi:hypothetical protein